MQASHIPLSGWDEGVSAPCQYVGFARAMTSMGYRPLYLRNGGCEGLALVRGWAPGIRWITARANLFAPGANPDFVREALKSLARMGIPYVKVGDTMWGIGWDTFPEEWPFRRSKVIRRHTFVLNLESSEGVLLKAMNGAERKIRKAEREGVIVRPIDSADDLEAFCQLSKETSARVRARTPYTEFPDAFFRILYHSLSPSGTARFYIGWYKDHPIACCLFLCTKETMLYYLGGSSRDRDLTAKQASSAIFWHAIREAKRLGMTRFDFGGCTPTDDPKDPRYGVYTFKKRWGGRLEVFYNLEVVISPVAFYLQERVLSPLWDRLHPAYFNFIQRRKERP